MMSLISSKIASVSDLELKIPLGILKKINRTYLQQHLRLHITSTEIPFLILTDIYFLSRVRVTRSLET